MYLIITQPPDNKWILPKRFFSSKLSTSTKYKVDAKAKDRHGRTALQEAERCNHKRLDIKQNRIIIFQIFPQPTN